MNDFLQSLRNGQAEKQRSPKTRKNFDNSYHYSSGNRFHSYGPSYQSNRNQQMKRQPVAHQGNQQAVEDAATTSILAEAIETLSNHIETLAENQNFLINAQERTADMMERQAVAIERIVSHLKLSPVSNDVQNKETRSKKTFENHYVSSKGPKKEARETQPAKTEAKKPVLRKRKKITAAKPVETGDSENKLLSREKIMEIIYSMRENGATFDQVAGRLIELGQPTFSGRGEWHAQTIHRLCNKK